MHPIAVQFDVGVLMVGVLLILEVTKTLEQLTSEVQRGEVAQINGLIL